MLFLPCSPRLLPHPPRCLPQRGFTPGQPSFGRRMSRLVQNLMRRKVIQKVPTVHAINFFPFISLCTTDRRKRQRSDSSPTYVSSDSDLRSPHKRGKRQAEGLREPYKLRRQPMSRQPYSPVIKNSPLKQKSAPKGISVHNILT